MTDGGIERTLKMEEKADGGGGGWINDEGLYKHYPPIRWGSHYQDEAGLWAKRGRGARECFGSTK